MHLRYRNVNTAFRGLVSEIYSGAIPTHREPSRVGEVLRVPEPVLVTFERPTERVLFNRARDCNPFFHLFESIWMLAGRNDVESLAYYNPRMREYSDNGLSFNGAYGHRWRYHFGCDQLAEIVHNLKESPHCRRQVLEIWSIGDLPNRKRLYSKDLPCNTHIYFALESNPADAGEGLGEKTLYYRRLNMTVCNRSNDLIWGLLGANVVHFSILQEYIAAAVGVQVGAYNQFTNNLHVYTERWEPKKWLDSLNIAAYDVEGSIGSPQPICSKPERFLDECEHLVEHYKSGEDLDWEEPWVAMAAEYMAAFTAHKERDYDRAFQCLERVQSADWREAGRAWLERRRDAYLARSANKA